MYAQKHDFQIGVSCGLCCTKKINAGIQFLKINLKFPPPSIKFITNYFNISDDDKHNIFR